MTDLSRRDFIQTALLIPPSLSLSMLMNQREKLKEKASIGVVGVGNRGHFLVDLLTQCSDVVIRAIADIKKEHAERTKSLCTQRQSFVPEIYTNGETDFENLVKREDIDCVLCATSWEWHTPVAISSMKAGKLTAIEVPAGITLKECWELIKTSNRYNQPCFMLENVCYFKEPLTILRMIREGLFGEVVHAEGGYQHDCRYLLADETGTLNWRGKGLINRIGNTYPTHPIGPISQWLNINRGDRFVSLYSVSTPPFGMHEYFVKKYGADHKLAKMNIKHGDINTTILQTALGKTVTLYHDTTLPRPYDSIFRVQGTKGIYFGSLQKIYLEDISPQKDTWEDFEPYTDKYAHPMWSAYESAGGSTAGHGLGDFITVRELVRAIRTGQTSLPDVYDSATWSAIIELSEQSASVGGKKIEFPDFTDGKWKTNSPIPIIQIPEQWLSVCNRK
ncbi:MAG: Gfo/Idh/MocA family oxidoreductase [Candidatus Hydrogenedens sp.]|nr:Gfo/Idh/MocA family oxidoreductase [Candidatus Hydrogenedens sp.]